MSKGLFILSMEGGHVKNNTAFIKFIRGLKDGKHKVEISEINKRSLNQNSYYWQMLTEYFQPGLLNIGWQHVKTKDDAHFFMADIFLKAKEINKETGEIKERTRSTTELTKVEFNIYLNELWQWAAEWLHVTIPAPNEQTILSYE